MARLNVINAHQVELILKIRDGEILHLDLASLYFVNKYGGDGPDFLQVTIPQSTNEDGTINPQICYAIRIEQLFCNPADECVFTPHGVCIFCNRKIGQAAA